MTIERKSPLRIATSWGRVVAASTNIWIMIVADYLGMARLLGKMLGQLGFNKIDTVQDATVALGRLRVQPYDLIISDWNMTPITGLGLLREVRADMHLKAIPFIMVSGLADTDHVIAAKRSGVDAFILKPFNLITLREKLIGVIGQF